MHRLLAFWSQELPGGVRRALTLGPFARTPKMGHSRLPSVRGPYWKRAYLLRPSRATIRAASVWSKEHRTTKVEMMLRRLFVWRLEPLRERLENRRSESRGWPSYEPGGAEALLFVAFLEVCAVRGSSAGGWLCAECKREGFTVAAAVVHHVAPLEKGAGFSWAGWYATTVSCAPRGCPQSSTGRCPSTSAGSTSLAKLSGKTFKGEIT